MFVCHYILNVEDIYTIVFNRLYFPFYFTLVTIFLHKYLKVYQCCNYKIENYTSRFFIVTNLFKSTFLTNKIR